MKKDPLKVLYEVMRYYQKRSEDDQGRRLEKYSKRAVIASMLYHIGGEVFFDPEEEEIVQEGMLPKGFESIEQKLCFEQPHDKNGVYKKKHTVIDQLNSINFWSQGLIRTLYSVRTYMDKKHSVLLLMVGPDVRKNGKVALTFNKDYRPNPKDPERTAQEVEAGNRHHRTKIEVDTDILRSPYLGRKISSRAVSLSRYILEVPRQNGSANDGLPLLEG